MDVAQDEREKEYTNLRVTGAVSVEPVKSNVFVGKQFLQVVVLIGPTGSGKSSFVEALASKASGRPLGISKDQLESVTKTVQIYCVRNVNVITGTESGDPIYLVDTPGFADPSISELHVLRDIKGWRDACNRRDAVRVLYFHPITDVRLPNSKLKCMEIVKSFWGAYNAETLTLITTMWDQVTMESKERAESRLIEIGDSWAANGGHSKRSESVRFLNTYDSAIQILDDVIEPKNRPPDVLSTSGYGDPEEHTGTLVVEEVLRERVRNIYQQLQRIEEDLDLETRTPSTQKNLNTDPELTKLLKEEKATAELLLEKFTSELKHMGQPDYVPLHWQDTALERQTLIKRTKGWMKSHMKSSKKS